VTHFDLRHLVQGIVSSKDSWNLDDLVTEVVARTSRKHLWVAYRTALREYARIELGNHTDTRPDQQSGDTQQLPVGPGPSQNVTRSRAALARAGFRHQIHVGPGAWKLLGLCTSAELLNAAAECDRMAEYNAERSRQYRMLANAMTEHGVGVVQDLPPEVVERIFDR